MTQTSPLSLTDPAHRRTAILCAIVLLLGCVLRLADLGGIQRRSPDENIYALQAHTLATAGPQALADQWRRDPSLSQYPGPVRLGYLVPLRWAQAITGRATPLAGAALSSLASMASLALIGLIAWRHLSPSLAPYAMALFAVCPPELMIARRAWMEACTGCMALVLMLLCLEALAHPGRRLWLLAAGLCAGWTITIKETSMSHAALLILLLCIALLRQKRLRDSAIVLAAVATAAIAGALWLGHALGGLAQVIDFYHRTYAITADQPYIVAYEAGSLGSWLYCIWVAAPLATSLAIAGVLSFAWYRPRPLLWALAVALLCFGLPAIAHHRLNLRYASLGFAPLCLLAAAGISHISALLGKNLPPTESLWTQRLAAALLFCALATNFLSFRERFVQTDLQDLSIRMVLNQPAPL